MQEPGREAVEGLRAKLPSLCLQTVSGEKMLRREVCRNAFLNSSDSVIGREGVGGGSYLKDAGPEKP